MLMVLSPAKSLDYESELPTQKASKAALLSDAEELANGLKSYSPDEISKLMSISEKLGELNFTRFQEWKLPMNAKNARQAVLAFKGDVYQGLDAYDFDEDDFSFAQEHLRILSGLYGLLRPLDRIAPYRLEMGTKYKNDRGKNLYEFWGSKISAELNKQLKKTKSGVLLNLASNEYFKSVDRASLKAEVISPVFKDWKNGKYKIISFFAKKARGRMAAFVIKNRLTEALGIQGFDWDGYSYNEEMSSGADWVFTRDEQ